MNTSIKGFRSNPSKSRPFLLIGLFSFVFSLSFILIGLSGQKLSFPLDDAWIHQTYARNLVQYGSWSFISGEVSGGSTSPLWTMIISVGYLLPQIVSLYWTILISILSFVALVIFSTVSFRNNFETSAKTFIFAGILIATEWHLLWAAASGMETILYCLGIVILFLLSTHSHPKWEWIGLVCGLLVWLRPDGITLAGPIVLILGIALFKKQAGIKQVLHYFFFFILLIAAYIVLNKLTTGNILPNTFYAKQVEYQELWAVPLGQRIINEFKPIFVGSGILLLPGFIFEIYEAIRSKKWSILAFIVWILGFGCMYAIRLPVTYQHGRYIIPVIPLFMIFSLVGSISLLQQVKKVKLKNLVKIGWCGAILITSLAFFWMGINGYKTDLKIINTLMVEPAKWIKENSQENDIIAVHDIGAMGYFSDRHIIDMGGLVNPEIIPFMRDETKLLSFLKSKNTAYFVGFSNWYKDSSQWGSLEKSYEIQLDSEKQTVIILKIH